MAMLEIKDKRQNHKSNHKKNSNATLLSFQIFSALKSTRLLCIFSSTKPSYLLCSSVSFLLPNPQIFSALLLCICLYFLLPNPRICYAPLYLFFSQQCYQMPLLNLPWMFSNFDFVYYSLDSSN